MSATGKSVKRVSSSILNFFTFFFFLFLQQNEQYLSVNSSYSEIQSEWKSQCTHTLKKISTSHIKMWIPCLCYITVWLLHSLYDRDAMGLTFYLPRLHSLHIFSRQGTTWVEITVLSRKNPKLSNVPSFNAGVYLNTTSPSLSGNSFGSSMNKVKHQE